MRRMRLVVRSTGRAIPANTSSLLSPDVRGAAARAAGLLMVALSAACGESPIEPTPQPTPSSVVQRIEITPGAVELQVWESRGLNAVPRTAEGRAISGMAVTWRSSNPQVARVDVSGNVTALGEGVALITATAGGKEGTARIEVMPPPPPPAVASVQVVGGNVDIEPSETRTLSVVLRAEDGSTVYGRPVTWTSSDSTIVRVLPDGTVFGVRGGTATITATSEGKTGETSIRIPEWLIFNLASTDGAALPKVIGITADTLERTEHGMVVRERRARLEGGRLWLSTVDGQYRQRYEVGVWERTLTWFNGAVIVTDEKRVDTRIISDQGEGRMYDLWTGQRVYESIVFTGHQFRVEVRLDRGRFIRQAIPGEGPQPYDLVFTK